jgi:uncharacterized membrane protein
MECYLVLLTLAGIAAFAVALAISVNARSGVRRASARIDELELAAARLTRQFTELRTAVAGGAAPEPAPPRPAEPPALRAERPAAFAAEGQEPAVPEAKPVPPRAAAPPPPAPPTPAEAFRPRPPAAEAPHAAPPVEPPPPPEPAPAIDWERWLGVRGAAILGGILFALAGLLFVRHAVEEGWLAPPVRVALGLLAGLGSLAGSQVLRRRAYEPTANALAGGGVVVLYGAVWAARVLYELIPMALAFALMVLVTAVAGLLAWRYRSLVVALLGLAGGFATPLLLDAGPDRPLGLFGYLLVLNLGLLTLARGRGWPLLAPLGLLATLAYQALWILGGMSAGELWLALGVLALFAALFALSGRLLGLPRAAAGDGEEAASSAEGAVWTTAAGVLTPFLFALYLAARADLAPDLWPVAALLVLLTAAAEALGRGLALPLLGGGAAAASLAVVTVWDVRGTPEGAAAWQVPVAAVVLAATCHLFAEWDRRRGHGPRSYGALATAGGFLVLLLASPLAAARIEPLPVLGAWLVLAALLVRQGWLDGVRRRPIAAAIGLGLGFPALHAVHGDAAGFPAPELYFALLLAAGVAFQLVAVLGRRSAAGGRRWAEPAALALPLAALAGLLAQAALGTLAPWLFLGLTLALALLAVLAATRMPAGVAYLLAMLLLALVHLTWSLSAVVFREQAPEVAAAGLAAMVAAVLLFSAWPFLAARRLESRPAAWWAAALAGPAWFLPLHLLWLERFGDGAAGLLPVILGAVALAAAFRVRGLWPLDDPRRLRGLAWFGAVALGFAALAVPLQLEKEWITIGWALEGAAVIALWRRLDHPGLKLFGLALLAAVAVRLVANPEVPGYHARSGLPILNWLLYTYLVPAAAMVGAAALLAPREVARRRAWEAWLYAAGRPLGAIGCAAAAVAVVFVWINLAIFDLFSTGRQISLALERTMARDLTLSLAWALYALILLAIGFGLRSRGLRGVSLALLAVTVGKVFLYDLSGLEDLYRVASLLGLAVSLVLVSLAYQRFVFRKPAGPPPVAIPPESPEG